MFLSSFRHVFIYSCSWLLQYTISNKNLMPERKQGGFLQCEVSERGWDLRQDSGPWIYNMWCSESPTLSETSPEGLEGMTESLWDTQGLTGTVVPKVGLTEHTEHPVVMAIIPDDENLLSVLFLSGFLGRWRQQLVASFVVWEGQMREEGHPPAWVTRGMLYTQGPGALAPYPCGYKLLRPVLIYCQDLGKDSRKAGS